MKVQGERGTEPECEPHATIKACFIPAELFSETTGALLMTGNTQTHTDGKRWRKAPVRGPWQGETWRGHMLQNTRTASSVCHMRTYTKRYCFTGSSLIYS